VSFPTFGWEQVADEPIHRVWRSDDGTVLSVNFFAVPPDLPSLDLDELEAVMGTRELEDGSRPLIIELPVTRDGPVPLVRAISRQYLPEHDQHVFNAALIAPLAACSWVVKFGRFEGEPTGLREALAFDDYARTHPDRARAGPPWVGFDPYVRERDDTAADSFDALTVVRRRIDEMQSAIEFRPEVLEQPAFVGGL